MKKTAATYEPDCQTDGFERLELPEWTEINDAIDTALKALDRSVRIKYPDVDVSSGCNAGRAWQLYSYRVYRPRNDTNVDPVVVGINCSSEGTDTLLHGDICGETLGDIIFELPDRMATGKLAVLNAARDLSDALAQRADLVAGALANVARRPE